ncbi:MAG TPA: hypothetical protein VGC08_16040 [Pedobacter sp.]
MKSLKVLLSFILLAAFSVTAVSAQPIHHRKHYKRHHHVIVRHRHHR